MNVLIIGAMICIFCTAIESLQSDNFHFRYDTRLVFNSTVWDEFRGYLIFALFAIVIDQRKKEFA